MTTKINTRDSSGLLILFWNTKKNVKKYAHLYPLKEPRKILFILISLKQERIVN